MELFSAQQVPNFCVGLSCPRCTTFHLLLLNFITLLSAHFSSLCYSYAFQYGLLHQTGIIYEYANSAFGFIIQAIGKVLNLLGSSVNP